MKNYIVLLSRNEARAEEIQSEQFELHSRPVALQLFENSNCTLHTHTHLDCVIVQDVWFGQG